MVVTMPQWLMSASLQAQLQSQHEPWRDRKTAQAFELMLWSQSHKQTSLQPLVLLIKLMVY